MQINPKPSLLNLGGKGYQLMKLKERFDIPPFFIIRFENQTELSDNENQWTIIDHCKYLKMVRMAVRSSASVEDSAKTSFAGMFKTILNVSKDELIPAIQQVIDSVDNKRVVQYCKTHGINHRNIKMSIIIQKMIRSRVSGVCFSKTKRKSEELIIEACYGLGEALVSGKITPDRYHINRNTLSIIKESISYQKEELTINKSEFNKPFYQEIPFHKRNAKKLTKNEIKNVAKTSILIENHLGFESVDVEWTIEEDKLYILQARPYTGFNIC